MLNTQGVNRTGDEPAGAYTLFCVYIALLLQLGGQAAHDMTCYFGLICSHSVWGSIIGFRSLRFYIFILSRTCHGLTVDAAYRSVHLSF
ncbi:hypothetical protein BDV19DRAFT_253305 [Aspergillus venezuelensis]